jgi:hypothetical protein
MAFAKVKERCRRILELVTEVIYKIVFLPRVNLLANLSSECSLLVIIRLFDH